MNDQNTDILFKAFPNLFRDGFFFECGDGWFELIGKAAAYIDSVTKDCHISQVKEKFGSLRIYIDFEVDENGQPLIPEEELSGIYKFIASMEHLSSDICEECGTDLNSANRATRKEMGYWLRSICVPCINKLNKRDGRKTQIED